MRPYRSFLEVLLTGLAFLLGVSAIPGGIALLAGFAPPVEMLKGSVFNDFVIPGLALVLAVGGSATTATVLLLKKSPSAVPTALAAGVAAMIFEFVEVLAIGSPPGPARVMQMLYFGIGVALATISSAILARPADGEKSALSNPQKVSISSNTKVSTNGNKGSNVSTSGNFP